MKNKILCMLAIALMSCGLVKAQKVVLSYGQFTQQSWTGTFFFANHGEEGPADDWFSKNFDDSSWGNIEGPISSVEGGLSYYNTVWEAEYGTYWVRRHFTINDLSQVKNLYLQVIHDDGCVAYLNGQLIYDDHNVCAYSNSILLDESVRSYLTEGDNVLAIRVNDSGGCWAFLDCGIYNGYLLINSTFDNNNGWTGRYNNFSYDNNTIAYSNENTFRCEQTIEGAPAGLYRLTANACGMEYYTDYNNAYAHKNEDLTAKLFIGSDEKTIPSAFDDMADIDYGYCWNVDGKFVPYYVDRTPWAFNRGMYHCELWSIQNPEENGKLTVGIYGNAPDNNHRWAAWDNLNIAYYSENDVTILLDSVITMFPKLIAIPQNAEVKKNVTSLVNNAKAAKSFEEKAVVFASIMQYEPTVRKSIKAYEELNVHLATLNTKLDEVTEFTSPATIDEAKALSKEVQNAHANGTYTNDDVTNAISRIEMMVIRLGYTYLDIAVTTPGAMGDSILSKVENFLDVKSLKLSGMLNDTDLSTIQIRLSQLREIDMTNVKMTTLPNRFFYQRSLLEIVKLPAQLTTIGEYAFYQCYGIKYIEFPATLTAINRYCFSECDNLQEVILPEGLNSIGECAFYSCDHNKYVKLPSSLEKVSSQAFSYNLSLKAIDFTEGLKIIDNSAFYQCESLTNLKFPNSLHYISTNSFAYNKSLANIMFNEGLYQIADNAFYDCDALTEVTLPSSLVLCSESPFDYCDNLKKVTCLSVEPPYMTDQIPYGLDMEGRELYVPALSLNVYKQTTGWDKFQTIKPIDYLPENFTVLGDLHLTLPESIPSDYKPNVSIIHDQKDSYYLQYGSLTVNGAGTLSMNNFDMVWDPNYQYDDYYSNRQQHYCSLINNSHLRSDNVSIDLYTRNDRWSFVSFPFNVKVSDIETITDGTTNWVIRRYDGQKRASGETSETWVRMNSDDVLSAGEGYIIQGSRYVDNTRQDYSGFRMKAINDAKKNLIFNSTNATISLNEYESEFAHNRSWNLVGNPYPCYYDTRFMDFNAPITVWNMRNNTYTAYSPSDDSYILCPGEAFFVQRPIDIDNGMINFAKEGRQTNRSVRTIETPARAKAYSKNVTKRIITNITISDGENTDRTRVVLNDDASMDYEMDKDATKFMSSDISVPQIFTSMNGINYAINERPISDGVVALNLRIGKDGIYSISLPEDIDGYIVKLEDKIEGKSIVLTAGDAYNFSTESGECNGRFILHFSDVATGINDVKSNILENNVIYSIQGAKVNTPTQKGIYIQNGKKIIYNK